MGGGSDDIGDVSWTVPTITLRYPANIPNLPGHHWADAIAMATPIAHKGSTAGAKAQAMTILDLLLTPALVDSAWSYFKNVQTKDVKYQPLMRPEDRPAIELNAGDHGEVSAGDEGVLLRPEEVQELPRAARRDVSDGAAPRRELRVERGDALGYFQRKSFSAAAKHTRSHAARIASWPPTARRCRALQHRRAQRVVRGGERERADERLDRGRVAGPGEEDAGEDPHRQHHEVREPGHALDGARRATRRAGPTALKASDATQADREELQIATRASGRRRRARRSRGASRPRG